MLALTLFMSNGVRALLLLSIYLFAGALLLGERI